MEEIRRLILEHQTIRNKTGEESWFAEHEPERYETELVTVPEETFPFEDVPGGRDYRWRRGHYDVYFYRREEGIIWGMTAKILRSLAEMYREDILLK